MKKDLVILSPHELVGYTFNWEKAYRYAKLMDSGVKFPPIRVHKALDGSLKIRNGMHRAIAAKLLGRKIEAEIATRDYAETSFFEDLEDSYKIK